MVSLIQLLFRPNFLINWQNPISISNLLSTFRKRKVIWIEGWSWNDHYCRMRPAFLHVSCFCVDYRNSIFFKDNVIIVYLYWYGRKCFCLSVRNSYPFLLVPINWKLLLCYSSYVLVSKFSNQKDSMFILKMMILNNFYRIDLSS